jgi:hypothetical protein
MSDWHTYEIRLIIPHASDLFVRLQAPSADHARRAAQAQYPRAQIYSIVQKV